MEHVTLLNILYFLYGYFYPTIKRKEKDKMMHLRQRYKEDVPLTGGAASQPYLSSVWFMSRSKAYSWQ